MYLTGPGDKMNPISDDARAHNLLSIRQSEFQEFYENQINRALIIEVINANLPD